MEATATPVNIYAEMTPNPATMKFVSNRLIIIGDDVVEYTSKEQTIGSSKLAEQLFNFPFIKGVFIAGNFITLTKIESVSWDMVTLELRVFIKSYLDSGSPAVEKMPETSNDEAVADAHNEAPVITSEMDQKIVDILEEYVRPAVEGDGGAIHFKSFDEGKVTVVLKGACSGCPSSTVTLKSGIEALLKQFIPEVTTVVAEEA